MELQLLQLPRAEGRDDSREGADAMLDCGQRRRRSKWTLLNASPDLPAQIASFPELLPPEPHSKDSARGSSIASVMLTDAELDHITGLLSLRDNEPIELRCTRRVFEWVFEANPIFAGLIQPSRFRWAPTENRQSASIDGGLSIEAVFVAGKRPTYVKTSFDNIEGSTLAYKVGDGRVGHR